MRGFPAGLLSDTVDGFNCTIKVPSSSFNSLRHGHSWYFTITLINDQWGYNWLILISFNDVWLKMLLCCCWCSPPHRSSAAGSLVAAPHLLPAGWKRSGLGSCSVALSPWGSAAGPNETGPSVLGCLQVSTVIEPEPRHFQVQVQSGQLVWFCSCLMETTRTSQLAWLDLLQTSILTSGSSQVFDGLVSSAQVSPGGGHQGEPGEPGEGQHQGLQPWSHQIVPQYHPQNQLPVAEAGGSASIHHHHCEVTLLHNTKCSSQSLVQLV